MQEDYVHIIWLFLDNHKFSISCSMQNQILELDSQVP